MDMNPSLVTGSEHNSVYPGIVRLYRYLSLGASIVFAVVGLSFLIVPELVVHFFNQLSVSTGLPSAPEHAVGLYDILAGAYMYVVTILAFAMYRQPYNSVYSLVLINAKSASALLSLVFFVFEHPYLIFLANAVTDGALAAGFFCLRSIVKGKTP